MAEPTKRAPDMCRTAAKTGAKSGPKSTTKSGAKSAASSSAQKPAASCTDAPFTNARFTTGRAQKGAAQVRRVGNRLSPEKFEAFFEALAETSNIRLSAESAGIAVATVKQRRRNDPEFARRFDMAKHEAHLDLEMRALHQGRFGLRQVEAVQRNKDGHVRTIVRDHALATLRAFDARNSAAIRRGAAALIADHEDKDAQSSDNVVASLVAAFVKVLRTRIADARAK